MNEEYTLSLEELGKIKTVKVYNQAYVDKQQERIETLERENAELKEKLNFSTQYYQGEKAKEQLTKAKELLTKWVELYKPKLESYPIPPIQEQTEQFLKEVEE